MSDRALPIVFINLCGEMIYVIQQRLEAQNISNDKASRVMQDIINTMLNSQFVEELFTPQSMYSRSALRVVFEKLVHSSIMRLNSTSMAKLYDLMMMVFKYQVVNCLQPQDLLLLTLNHLDGIEACVKPFPDIMSKIDHVYSLLMMNYKNMPLEDYESLRIAVLIFLQDLNIRVSVLLKLGYQLPNGDLVIHKDELVTQDPNLAETTMKAIDATSTSTDNVQINSDRHWLNGSLDRDGNRGTALGTNIYMYSAEMEPSAKSSEFLKNYKKDESKENNTIPTFEEINLLVRLIGKCKEEISSPEIVLSSIEDDVEEVFNQKTQKENSRIVNIDASKVTKQEELNRISKDLIVEENSTIQNDILELLDIAELSV